MPMPSTPLTVTDAAGIIGDAGFGPQPHGVGLELEYFVVGAFGSPVTDIETLRTIVEADGELPCASRLTFEPGGQLEISTARRDSGPEAIEAAQRDSLAVRSRLAAHGLSCIAVGTDAGGQRPRVLDEPRYRAMAEYFARRGCAGATMMRNTASMQVNVPYAPDLDAQWEYAHDLAPVLAAVFAHSPLLDRRPTGWQSTRLATWAALDPARTRPVALAAVSAREAWTAYALAAPVMLRQDGPDCTVPGTPLTLQDWIERGHDGTRPDENDIAYHLTTLFPPIRPRGWLECRMLDAVPEPWWAVAAAVTITALTHAETRALLTPVVDGASDRWLDAAWYGVHDPTLAELGRVVLATTAPVIAASGYCSTVVEQLDEFRARYTDRGRSLADDLLDRFALLGTVTPEPERVPATSR